MKFAGCIAKVLNRRSSRKTVSKKVVKSGKSSLAKVTKKKTPFSKAVIKVTKVIKVSKEIKYLSN